MSTVIKDETAKARIKANLADAMQRANMSQADLARATGESEMRISHYRTGSRIPSLAVAARISEALNIKMENLLK